MNSFLLFAGEHPILTVILALIAMECIRKLCIVIIVVAFRSKISEAEARAHLTPRPATEGERK